MKKWIMSVCILVVLAAGGGWVYFHFKHDQNPVMAANATTTVKQGELNVEISGSGSVASASSKDVKTSSMDEVNEVLVSKNDTVKKGDELLTFTDGSDPLVAPISGTVTSVDVSSGDKVNNDQAVAHITNYKKLKTTIKVDELDISKVKVGQTSDITASAFPDETFKGKVTNVAREGEANNGVATFDVTVSITDAKKLKVGMSTEASILTESAEDALYVPVEAVHTSGDQKYVVLADGEKDSDAAESNAGRATSRIEVETGIYNDTYVEITSGLEAGQKVQLPTIERSKGDTKESSEMGDGMRLGDGPEGGQGPGNGNQGPGMMPGGNNGSGMGGSSQGPGRGGE